MLVARSYRFSPDAGSPQGGLRKGNGPPPLVLWRVDTGLSRVWQLLPSFLAESSSLSWLWPFYSSPFSPQKVGILLLALDIPNNTKLLESSGNTGCAAKWRCGKYNWTSINAPHFYLDNFSGSFLFFCCEIESFCKKGLMGNFVGMGVHKAPKCCFQCYGTGRVYML